MTLTKHFNSKSQINRRERAETETFGGKSLSRYACAVSLKRRKQAEVQPVAAPVAVRAYRMEM